MTKQLTVDKDMVKTLKIGDNTHERLKKFGQFGDSFEDILNRLMDIAEGKQKK
jgi:predicted CopG family antitoxin